MLFVPMVLGMARATSGGALERAYVPSSDGVGAMLAASLYATVALAILVVVNKVEGGGGQRGGANLILGLEHSNRS